MGRGLGKEVIFVARVCGTGVVNALRGGITEDIICDGDLLEGIGGIGIAGKFAERKTMRYWKF